MNALYRKRTLFLVRKRIDLQKLWTCYSFVNTMQVLMLVFIMLLLFVYFLTSNDKFEQDNTGETRTIYVSVYVHSASMCIIFF